jgi:hypothetical protein
VLPAARDADGDAGVPGDEPIEEPTLSPDGRALVYSRWNGGASLWLLRLGSPGTPAASKQ